MPGDVPKCLTTPIGIGTIDTSGLLQILLAFPIAILALSASRSSSAWGGVASARLANIITVALTLAALYISSLPSLFSVGGLLSVWFAIVAPLVVVSILSASSAVVRAVVQMEFITREVN